MCRARLVNLLLLAVVLGCTNTEPQSSRRQPAEATVRLANWVATARLKKHVRELADDRYEGRNAGYPGERRAAQYIAGRFRELGLRPMGDRLSGGKSFLQGFEFVPRRPPSPTKSMKSTNVLALLEGSDPKLKSEFVLVGAHHDGQGMEGQADPGRDLAGGDPSDRIWNSADDNASSVAVVLEIACVLSKNRRAVRRSILFATFGAEEHGLDGEAAIRDRSLSRCGGSEHYARHPALPLDRHVAMVNLEVLGRSPEVNLEALATDTSSRWNAILERATSSTGTRCSAGPLLESSNGLDHYPFGRRGIPAIMLGIPGDRSRYHRRHDDADSIDYVRLRESATYALALTLELANGRRP